MLTLIRLRLNFSGKDLAYRFGGVHETTVSRIFFNVLDVLYLRLNALIYWPEREQSTFQWIFANTALVVWYLWKDLYITERAHHL